MTRPTALVTIYPTSTTSFQIRVDRTDLTVQWPRLLKDHPWKVNIDGTEIHRTTCFQDRLEYTRQKESDKKVLEQVRDAFIQQLLKLG